MGNMKPKGGTLVAPGKASRPHPVRGVDFIFRGVDSIFRGVDYLPYIGGVDLCTSTSKKLCRLTVR